MFVLLTSHDNCSKFSGLCCFHWRSTSSSMYLRWVNDIQFFSSDKSTKLFLSSSILSTMILEWYLILSYSDGGWGGRLHLIASLPLQSQLSQTESDFHFSHYWDRIWLHVDVLKRFTMTWVKKKSTSHPNYFHKANIVNVNHNGR